MNRRLKWYYKHKNDPGFKERVKKYSKIYNRKNRKVINVRMRLYRNQVKQQAYNILGGRCVCCGEKEKAFLSVDHIHGGGRKERQKLRDVGIYFKIIRMKDAKEKYRILCMNCNHAMGRHNSNGVCPHER